MKTWQKLQALNGIVYLLYFCNSTHFFYQVAWFYVLFMSKVQRDLFKSITQNLSNSNSDAFLSRHHLVLGFFLKGKLSTLCLIHSLFDIRFHSKSSIRKSREIIHHCGAHRAESYHGRKKEWKNIKVRTYPLLPFSAVLSEKFESGPSFLSYTGSGKKRLLFHVVPAPNESW